MRKAGPYPATATVQHFVIGEGADEQVIGMITTITYVGGRTFWVAESHDWEADPAEQAAGFVPLPLGVFQDPAEAEALIERRAREAQAPGTVPDENPEKILRDMIEMIVGDEQVITVKREDGFGILLEATIQTEGDVMDAAQLRARLRAALPTAILQRTDKVITVTEHPSALQDQLRGLRAWVAVHR